MEEAFSWWLPTNQPGGGDFTVLSTDGRVLAGCPQERSRTIQTKLAGKNARVQSCWCYEGRAMSFTVRTDHKYDTCAPQQRPDPLRYSGYQPSPEIRPSDLACP